jgi:hypothetical protein
LHVEIAAAPTWDYVHIGAIHGDIDEILAEVDTKLRARFGDISSTAVERFIESDDSAGRPATAFLHGAPREELSTAPPNLVISRARETSHRFRSVSRARGLVVRGARSNQGMKIRPAKQPKPKKAPLRVVLDRELRIVLEDIARAARSRSRSRSRAPNATPGHRRRGRDWQVPAAAVRDRPRAPHAVTLSQVVARDRSEPAAPGLAPFRAGAVDVLE